MATYFIVDKDKDPLGPNEIQAGDTIDVENGDVFYVFASANDNITFESATGNPANFEIRFETSNANDFQVEIMENLDAGIVISNGIDLTDVDIKADKSLSVIMTAGNDVSLGKFEGSSDGVDLVTIGHGFSTDHDILLNGGDNFLTIGDNANIQKIKTEEGADTITIGEGLTADDIETGDGNDELSIGDGAWLDNIDVGIGDDTISIGNDLNATSDDPFVANSIKTGDGNDVLTIRNNASLNDIDTGKGDDTVALGDDLVADDIKTGDGDDVLTIGDGASLHNIDTGKGNDTIEIGDNLFANDIKTGEGADGLTIGDGALVDDVDTGKGNDTVTVGDFFTADKLETKDGDDIVIAGIGGSIDDLDGGNGNDTLDSDTNYPDATSFETICFARGTLIETENGDVPIEALRAGDRVKTLDNGLQCIRWINSTCLPGHGVHAPVRIAAGALGNARTLWVSQQHRMLLSSWNIELLFGEGEVLVAAKHLVGLAGIKTVDLPSVEYFHMLFDRHEIVFAEGIESESFHPGDVGMNTLSAAQRAEVCGLFPSLRLDPNSFGTSARLSLKSFEAAILAA